MTSSTPAREGRSPLARSFAKLSAPCLSPRGFIDQNWRRLGSTDITLLNEDHPLSDGSGLGELSGRRDSTESFKQQATHSSILDDVAARTSQATQSSSLNYKTGTWSNTISSLRVGATTMVAKPWSILTLGAALLAIVNATYLEEHILAIPVVILVTLGGTMSLLLAFRLNSSYSRWWEARNLWGKVILGSRQLIIELVTDSHTADQEALQLQAAGWSIAFAVALKHHLRFEKIPIPPVRPGGEAHPAQGPFRLLSFKDCANLAASRHPPLYALTRLRQTVRLYDAGTRDGAGAGREMNLFRVHQMMSTALTGCERILRTPCPAGYVGMLRSVLIVWLCFLPFTLVAAMGLFMVPVYSLTVFLVLKASPSEPSPKGGPSPPAPAARYLRSRELVPCALRTRQVEQLAVEIENPFGEDFNDLPLEIFCLTVESDALRLLAEFDTDGPDGFA